MRLFNKLGLSCVKQSTAWASYSLSSSFVVFAKTVYCTPLTFLFWKPCLFNWFLLAQSLNSNRGTQRTLYAVVWLILILVLLHFFRSFNAWGDIWYLDVSFYKDCLVFLCIFSNCCSSLCKLLQLYKPLNIPWIEDCFY